MAEILERPLGPTRHRLDVDAYYRLAEAGILTDPHRVELIDGEIFDLAAIGSPHAAVTNRLVRYFARAIADGLTLASVQNPLRLDAHNVPHPDLTNAAAPARRRLSRRPSGGSRRPPPRRSLRKLARLRAEHEAAALC